MRRLLSCSSRARRAPSSFLLAVACASCAGLATSATHPQHEAAPGSYAQTPLDETLLLQEPTLSAEHLVFVYAGDLWIAPREGGDARHLTSSPGMESAPQLSPDGQWVAFSGQYDGNTDVYLIHVDGGVPRRLTWHPGRDVVLDWNGGGDAVLFRSSRSSGTRNSQVYLAPVTGEFPEALPVPKAYNASFGPDDASLAYTIIPDAFRTWRRYRGGCTTPIWVQDLETHEVEVVPHADGSDTFPRWLGETLYFASDRAGTMDLYCWRRGQTAVERLTDLGDFDLRNMDTGGGALVFEAAGALHVLEAGASEARRVSIRVRNDGLAAVPRWQEVGEAVRAAAIAPNGKRAVFEARGEILSVPREHGEIRNLSASPGAHDRSPIWSPDGERIAWFSDASGEYQLLVREHRGRGAARAYDLGEGGFFYDPRWSPDGEHILFADKFNLLTVIALESGELSPVASVQGSLDSGYLRAVWSPDSQWIALQHRDPATSYGRIALYEMATGKLERVTDGFGHATDPAFSPDGKLLFFAASVNNGPKFFDLDMTTSASRPSNESLYVAVLQADGVDPLGPRSDEGWDEEEEEDQDPDDDDEEEAELPALELAGLDQRILALPLPAGNYRDLACTQEALLWIEQTRGQQPRLRAWDREEREAKTLREDVDSFQVSADGKSLLLDSSGEWFIAGADAEDPDALDVESAKVRVVPEEEWTQILREVWRIQRDYFYDENMHGVDWPAMWRRWQPFLAHVRHPAELDLLVRSLISELACGHEGAESGDSPEGPEGVSVGLLGADWIVDGDRYRLERILRGQNWNPNLRAPLTAPGVDAAEGDYLLAVDGRPLTTEENLYAAFEARAGQPVELTLAADPGAPEEQRRTTTVVPIASEGDLRRLSWVEANRARVDELSGGRLAYIYMPDTATDGMDSFDRDFYSQLDKQGIVLDERYNGGGQAADYVISVLDRELDSWWMTRERWACRTPFGLIDGPKVMVINEDAGSGGDWMPWAFRNRGIGPLVGTRTWGGLVGTSVYPVLMHGGSVTAASFGVMDTDGQWAVENIGVPPDVEVIEWPAEVLAGHDPQLERAIELALELLEQQPPRAAPEFYPPAER
ncbi:MAG: PDZ domain-containing protein [Planctomycetota bacterium]|nr:PDZ domain-containing protein [Planctomycetota bacterium]